MKAPSSGVAEILIPFFWKLLPQSKRESLSRFIVQFQERAALEAPRSNVRVWKPKVNGQSRLLAEPPAYSLLCTCLNEEGSITEFLNSVAAQTKPPAEIVICDGGSSDGTPSLLDEWSDTNPDIRLNLIRAENQNIASGRNIAAKGATQEVFLFADAGTVLEPDWAEQLLTPIAEDPAVEVSMGWYDTVTTSDFQKAVAHFTVPYLENIDPATFFPSARSLAIKRSAFELIGGFPEFVSLAGEDSLFDYYLKCANLQMAFVPAARVKWTFPQGFSAIFKTIFHYAKGDAEGTRVAWSYYYTLLGHALKISVDLLASAAVYFLASTLESNILWLAFLFMLVGSVLRVASLFKSYSPFHNLASDRDQLIKAKAIRIAGLATMILAQTTGFVSGLLNRKSVEEKRLASATHGHLVLMLPTPLIFQRGEEHSAMVEDCLKKNYYVTIVYARDLSDAQQQVPMFAHPHLEQHMETQFDFQAWKAKHGEFLKLPEFEFRYINEFQYDFSNQLSSKFSSIKAQRRRAAWDQQVVGEEGH